MRTRMLLLVLLVCGPWLAPYDPQRSLGLPWQLPGETFWLGTDGLGRDVLSRLLAGGGSMLFIPLASTLIACLLGTVVGMALVTLPDRGRHLVQLFDTFLILPPLLVIIVIIYLLGPGPSALALSIILLNAPFTARYIRALVDPMLDHSYVVVVRAAGDPLWLVLVREVVPGLYAAIGADVGTRLVAAIYLLSSASFLGFGMENGGSNWASMVRDGQEGLALNPSAALFPAACLALTVVMINLSADRRVQRC